MSGVSSGDDERTSLKRHMGGGGEGRCQQPHWDDITVHPNHGRLPQGVQIKRGRNETQKKKKKWQKQREHEEETEHGHSAAAARYLRTWWDLRRHTGGRCGVQKDAPAGGRGGGGACRLVSFACSHWINSLMLIGLLVLIRVCGAAGVVATDWSSVWSLTETHAHLLTPVQQPRQSVRLASFCCFKQQALQGGGGAVGEQVWCKIVLCMLISMDANWPPEQIGTVDARL